MSDREAEFKKAMKELRDHYSYLIHSGKADMKEYRTERHKLIREFRKEKMSEQFKLWSQRKQDTIYDRRRKRKLQDAVDDKNIPIKSLDEFGGDS